MKSLSRLGKRITFVLDEEMSGDDECRETLQGINNNGKLSEGYLMLACDIEVMEPKSSEDIYKDKLMTVPSEASSGGSSGNWVFKNKAHGKASAAASLIRSKFSRVLEDKKMPLDVIVFTAISLGLVYVGSCDEDISQTIISALKHQNLSKLGQPLTCLLPLGLDLLYLGKQKSVEGTAEISKTLNTKIRTHCDMILFSCAYAGIGDVLKVQYLLGQCAQHLKRGETHQGPTVLRIAMVAMAEELGLEMVIRC
ncbi:26S proteasome non-ATPase regulatory subunit 2 homolog A-like isoform X6 [Camellia sinensis]|uniref:26S proteasome non-ATPase regulatory subunit 2 homolog A-like isoform X6 n=1 Tax=Camellia sinensis TaxID=4442 RepID=UPI001036A757|nr:26S proteasome non-ATPase regulatory subunit 2 homolog A-like isoform X6 [Camellia sinensis]